jgi:hypothetical protein
VPDSRCCVCSTYKKYMGRRYWGHSHNYHPTGLTSLTPSPTRSPRGPLSPSKFSPRRHSPRGHSVSPLRPRPRRSLSPNRLRPRRSLSPNRLKSRKCLFDMFEVECSLSLDLVCFAWVVRTLRWLLLHIQFCNAIFVTFYNCKLGKNYEF